MEGKGLDGARGTANEAGREGSMTVDEMKRRVKALENKNERPYKSAVVHSQEEFDQLRAAYPDHNLIIITWNEDIVERDCEGNVQPTQSIRIWG
jgi:hypothetical protein